MNQSNNSGSNDGKMLRWGFWDDPTATFPGTPQGLIHPISASAPPPQSPIGDLIEEAIDKADEPDDTSPVTASDIREAARKLHLENSERRAAFTEAFRNALIWWDEEIKNYRIPGETESPRVFSPTRAERISFDEMAGIVYKQSYGSLCDVPDCYCNRSGQRPAISDVYQKTADALAWEGRQRLDKVRDIYREECDE